MEKLIYVQVHILPKTIVQQDNNSAAEKQNLFLLLVCLMTYTVNSN